MKVWSIDATDGYFEKGHAERLTAASTYSADDRTNFGKRVSHAWACGHITVMGGLAPYSRYHKLVVTC